MVSNRAVTVRGTVSYNQREDLYHSQGPVSRLKVDYTTLDKSFLASDTELVNSYSYSAIRVRNTTAVKPFRPMMTTLVHEALRNSQILSKMAPKRNFKNGATNSAILG